MSETIYEFKEGPYELLNFTVKTEEGKAVIEINGGDLGRLPIETLETVKRLREGLDEIEEYLEELERKKEQL